MNHSLSKPSTLKRIFFWLSYGLVGFWVALAGAIALWGVGLALSIQLPLAALYRVGLFPLKPLSFPSDVWLYQQNDFTYFMMFAALSALGIFVTWLALVATRVWVNFHQHAAHDVTKRRRA